MMQMFQHTPTWLLTLLGALILAGTHQLAGAVRPERSLSRSGWRSFVGGAGCGYVFVFILPELAAHQARMTEGDQLTMYEREIFLMALVGLAAYYGLDRLARRRQTLRLPVIHRAMSKPDFWLHMGGFGIYNAIVGYILGQRQEMGLAELTAYVAALGMHFFVNDHDLQEEFGDLYRQVGRWVLSGLVVLGWVIGAVLAVEHVVTGLLFAFLAGGMILNILKQELPSEKDSSFRAFGLGVVTYIGFGLLHGI